MTARRAVTLGLGILIGLVFGLILHAFGAEARCGVERWAVKVGTDRQADHVDPAEVHEATVAQLVAWRPPADLGRDTPRVWPHEMQVWRLHATLVAYKAEADSDYHLVLRDDVGNTMIAEIPSPTCARNSAWAKAIQAARADFEERLDATARVQRTARPVTVIGVGFFDVIHGQLGVAPNGVELHPVLAIEFR